MSRRRGGERGVVSMKVGEGREKEEGEWGGGGGQGEGGVWRRRRGV